MVVLTIARLPTAGIRRGGKLRQDEATLGLCEVVLLTPVAAAVKRPLVLYIRSCCSNICMFLRVYGVREIYRAMLLSVGMRAMTELGGTFHPNETLIFFAKLRR
jgi:hypothetical protein